jgi:hypothetical protein
VFIVAVLIAVGVVPRLRVTDIIPAVAMSAVFPLAANVCENGPFAAFTRIEYLTSDISSP